MNMDYVKRHGYKVTREYYKLVYDDFLEEQDTLESLYVRFNVDHPEDFRGHSMSVSDVVVLYKDGDVKSYYVDSIGFAEVPEFLMKQELQKDIRTQMENQIDHVNVSGKLLTAEEKELILKGASQFDNMESADQYVREVILYLAEHGKQGLHTEQDEERGIQKEPWKAAEELAEKLMQFAEDHDYYNYSDYLDNREQQLQDLTGDIFMGKAFGIQDFLYGVVDESKEPEIAGRAICLCQDLKDYAEQWENNLCRQDKLLYSMSDGNRSIKDRLSENRNRIDRSLKSQDQNILKMAPIR